VSISINIDEETPEAAMRAMRILLGGGVLAQAFKEAGVAAEHRETVEVPTGHVVVRDEEGRATGTEQEAPTRERGQPSPGKSRRTKAEIAEDEAAEEKELLGTTLEKAEVLMDMVEEAAAIGVSPAELKQAISTGDERVGPEDDAETVEQDAADEKAETEAARDPEKPLSLDDVRGALGAYVKKFGMDAAQQDGPKVLKMVCGDACAKISDIPDDQAKIKGVVDGIGEMLTKNPFQREAA